MNEQEKRARARFHKFLNHIKNFDPKKAEALLASAEELFVCGYLWGGADEIKNSMEKAIKYMANTPGLVE